MVSFPALNSLLLLIIIAKINQHFIGSVILSVGYYENLKEAVHGNILGDRRCFGSCFCGVSGGKLGDEERSVSRPLRRLGSSADPVSLGSRAVCPVE